MCLFLFSARMNVITFWQQIIVDLKDITSSFSSHYVHPQGTEKNFVDFQKKIACAVWVHIMSLRLLVKFLQYRRYSLL